MEWWHNFRNFMTMRVKIAFTTNLTVRGFEGKLEINHEKETLDVKVRCHPENR